MFRVAWPTLAALAGMISSPYAVAETRVALISGMWTMKVPSPQGISTCYWDFNGSGAYSAWCVGAAPLAV